MKFRKISRRLLLLIVLISVLSSCVSPVLVTPAEPTVAPTATPVLPTADSKLPDKGILIFKEITSPALADNLIGDPDTRPVVIYLPPSYRFSDKRYPVVYALHYYTGSEWTLAGPLPMAMNGLIAEDSTKEMILVFPNANNRFQGSYYMNSPVIGDYETYITRDLVDYIDTNFRTLPHRDSRGITGCSMGGDGTIRLGFKYPEVFGVAAPVSGKYEYEKSKLWDDVAWQLTTIPTDFTEFNRIPWQAQNLFALAAVAAPAVDSPPLYLEQPFMITDGEGQIVPNVRQKVNELDAVHAVHDYLEQSTRLSALLIYHSTEDDIAPVETVREFDAMLTELGVAHEYLEVEGDHCDLDYTPVVQFMSDHLVFEESP